LELFEEGLAGGHYPLYEQRMLKKVVEGPVFKPVVETCTPMQRWCVEAAQHMPHELLCYLTASETGEISDWHLVLGRCESLAHCLYQRSRGTGRTLRPKSVKTEEAHTEKEVVVCEQLEKWAGTAPTEISGGILALVLQEYMAQVHERAAFATAACESALRRRSQVVPEAEDGKALIDSTLAALQCAARTRRIVTGDPRFHEAASFYLTPTCGMLAKYFTERMYGAVPADWSASRGLSLTWPCA
jgi:hypothetical protein